MRRGSTTASSRWTWTARLVTRPCATCPLLIYSITHLRYSPTPAGHGHGAATLKGTQPGAAVTVLNALGRPVASGTADASGTAALALPAGLPTGVYLVRAGSKAVRLTVE